MLEYNEIKERKVIVYEGAPFEILTSHVFRKQQRKPVNAVKMKNLLTGKVMEISFHQSEKLNSFMKPRANTGFVKRKIQASVLNSLMNKSADKSILLNKTP